MDEAKPVWTTSSFLLYAGGLTVLGAAVAALGYLSGQYGNAAYAGWAALSSSSSRRSQSGCAAATAGRPRASSRSPL